MNIYTSLLKRNPNFRTLWLASVVTMLGDWFNTIGTIVLINRYTDSGVAIAALFLARMLPPFIFSPMAGLLADKINRKTIMVVSDLLRVVIVLGFLLVDSPSEAWLVYALTALQFAISTFYHPAHAAILPTLVEDHSDLLLANTLGSVTWSAMLAVGAAAGGLITAWLGVETALVIDSATFALSALVIGRVTVPTATSVDAKNALAEDVTLLGGLRYVIQNPEIGAVTLVKALGHIGSVNVVITALASTLFVSAGSSSGSGDGGASAIGMMMTAGGIGAVAGPLLANRFTPETDSALRRSIVVGFAALSLGWLLAGQFGLFWLVLVGLTIRSMGGSINWTYSSVLLQMNVPNYMLGRVFALDEMIRTLTASLGIWLAGYAIDSQGVTAQSLASWYGLITLVPLLIWWWYTWSEEQSARGKRKRKRNTLVARYSSRLRSEGAQ